MSGSVGDFPSDNSERNRGVVAVIMAVGTVVVGALCAWFPVVLPVFTGMLGATSVIIHSYFSD
jgi:uncharacterized protein (DUF697 family)